VGLAHVVSQTMQTPYIIGSARERIQYLRYMDVDHMAFKKEERTSEAANMFFIVSIESRSPV
jgi:hypothetical protein